MATSPRRFSQPSDSEDFISTEDMFRCPKSDWETINKSPGFVGVKPIEKHKALTTASYLPIKKQKVHEAVSEKFEICCCCLLYFE